MDPVASELAVLGWGPAWENEFGAFRSAGLEPARVAVEDKHAYVLLGGAGEVTATVAGRLLHEAQAEASVGLPKVGDWVAAARSGGSREAVIEAVLPRRTRLARKLAGREVAEQVLAANLDTAMVVQSLDATFNLRRLERFLVMAHEGGARPVVVLNKADLGEQVAERARAAVRSAGAVPVIVASARTGQGLEELRAWVRPGETVALVGTSGVGKSSLINRLYGEDIQATLEVRARDAKGRHTTTWRELIVLPSGGLVIDTPGMREFHMWVADEGLEETFPDIAELAAGCRFRDCRHASEAPCAVKDAVASGKLDRGRYESYLKLQRELAYLSEERRQHTYQVRKRRAKTGVRAFLRRPKDRSGGRTY